MPQECIGAVSLLWAFFSLTVLSAGGSRGNPQGPEAGRLAAAQDAARAGNYELAAREYAKLVAADPQSAELWSNLGAVRALGGHCADAFPALERARALNPRLFAPWYFDGYCSFAMHRDERVLEDMQHALELAPRDANAWFLKAQAAANLDRLEDSFRSLIETLALDPGRPEAYYLAGKTSLDLATKCYDIVLAAPGPSPYALRLEGERNAGQGVWNLAIQAFQKAEELRPSAPDLRFSLGTAYLESKRYPEAEAEFRRCLDLRPRSTWAALRLAVSLILEVKGGEARAILGRIDPESLETPEEIQDYLTARYLLGELEAAREALDRAVKRFADDASLHEWKTRLASLPSSPGCDEAPLLELQGLTRAALSVRFSAVSESPAEDFGSRLFRRVAERNTFRAAFVRGDYQTVGKMVASIVHPLPREADRAFTMGEIFHWLSIRLYEHLGAAFPDSEVAQKLAAENLSAAGQQDKALEIYRAMRDRTPHSPELLLGIAKIYWTQQRWDEALSVLQALSDVDPYNPTVFVNMGRIYSYRQDPEGAEKSFRQAIGVDPKMPEAYLGLGESLRRKGNDRDALREFKIASNLDPENPRAHYMLAQVYRKLGQSDLAARELVTFQRIQARAASEKIRRSRELVPVGSPSDDP